MTDRPKRLGKGLDALLGDAGRDAVSPSAGSMPHDSVRTLPIELIEPNHQQPRKQFAADELESLAASVKEQGVVQPVLLRPHPDRSDHYQIIAGERRWRAAQLARLHDIPVVIRDLDDRTALEVAIIENVQRADLSPLEEAEGYRRLIEEFGETQDSVAKRVGKSRSHIANSVRLLGLPDAVRSLLANGAISAGHARALIGHPDAELLANQIVSKQLNVRQLEKLAQGKTSSHRVQKAKSGPTKSADIRALEQDLSTALGLSVSVESGDADGESGEVNIRYKTLEQLDDVIRRLKGSPV